jgi:hypothetical protein
MSRCYFGLFAFTIDILIFIYVKMLALIMT